MRGRRTGLAALLILLALAFAARIQAQTGYGSIYGFDQASYQSWVDEVAKTSRIVYVSAYDDGKQSRYIALNLPQRLGPRWELHTDLSEAEFKKKNSEYHDKGYYPTCVTGYLKGNVPHFGGIWVKDRKHSLHVALINLKEQDLFALLQNDKIKGSYLPEIIVGYADGNGSYRFAVLRVPAGKTVWDAQLNLTEAQYETALEDGQAKGFRPMSVTAYPTPKGLRFALVSIKDNMTYREKHGISVKEYNDEYLRMRKAGFIPVSVSGYVNAAGPREDSYLAVSKYMAERQITVGTFTISRNGQPIHHGGLDLSDASRPRLPGAVIPMRLGGVTKAITAAAIHTLIREGKLSLDTQTFRLLGLKPPPGQKPDPRLNDITIRHLLEHKGGWDQTQTFDPMLRPLDIASALKVPAPPGPVDIIRYMMGQPLQFDPGSRVCPSNFGYCVLGRVIEKVSGQTYLAYVRKNIFAPLSCTSVELARSLPKYRNSREPHYLDPGKGRNVLDPDSTEEVPSPDGTFYLEAMDSTSGLIASSHDMARFLDAFWLTGERREGPIRPGVLLDSQPGSCSLLMQRSNGVSFAAFFNRGTNLAGPDHLRIRDMMQEIADRQTGSEVRYAAVWVKSP